jgi:PAS domain S-box-containing protein
MTMENSNKHTRPIFTGGCDDIRHCITPGSLSRTLSLFALSFLFLAAVVVGSIWHNLRGAYQDTLAYWSTRLSSSADGRVKFDTLWLDERRRDAAVVAENLYTARLLSAARDRAPSGLLEARRHVEQELAGIQRAKGYLRAVVIDPRCRLVAQSSAPQEGTEDLRATCQWVYQSGKSSLTASVLGQGHIRLHIADPVFAHEVTRPASQTPLRVLGAVILVAEPWKELLPFFALESGPSRTGETLLVWKQNGGAVIFSPLHKTRGETCVFRRPLGEMSFEPLVAREGEVPFGEYTDYRGGRVFAVAKRILAGASVVRKVDRGEALSEYRRRAVLEALVGALSILLFGFLMLAQHRKAARRGLRDKARQQRALLKLKQHVEISEERFAKAFQASPTALTITSLKEDRYIEVNDAFERMSGWRRDDIIGRTEGELRLWADPEALERVKQSLNAERRLRNVESLFRTKRGEQRVGLLSAEIIEFAGELCALSVLDDVTERKRAEEELRQSKEELQDVMASIPDYLWSVVVDDAGNWNYRYHSSVVEKITGRPPEFYSRGPDAWLSTVHPEDQPRMLRAFERIQAGQETRQDHEYRIVLPDGVVRWVLDSAKARRQNGGIRIDGVVSDITERKQAEEALRRQAAFDELMTHILARFATCRYCKVDTSVTAALQATAEFIGVDRAYVIMLSPDRTWSGTHEWCGPDTPSRLHDYQNIPLGTKPWSENRLVAGEVIRVNHSGDLPPEALPERRSYDKEGILSLLGVPFKAAVGEVRGCIALISEARPVVWSDIDVAHVKMVGDAIANVIERKRTEEALRKSEERWRAVFENSAAGIGLGDITSGRILRTNLALQRMLGYSEEELRALSFMDITYEGDREANRQLLAELLEGGRPSFKMQKRYRRKDSNLIWASVHVSLVPGTQSIPQLCMAIVEDISERKRAQEELQHSFKQLRALTARLQGIREEERKSVAREIHDELGQALTAIKIDLASLVRELPADRQKQRKRAYSVLELVGETIQSVRRISTELRPGVLDDLGLVAALEWAAEEFEARTGTRCRLDLPEEDIEIDQERATAMFRIFQETLTNVARHADATEVAVRLAKENSDLTLEVHDNGRGISEEQLSGGRSLGILGMRERAALLGGEFGVIGGPKNGTTVRVRIPVAHC